MRRNTYVSGGPVFFLGNPSPDDFPQRYSCPAWWAKTPLLRLFLRRCSEARRLEAMLWRIIGGTIYPWPRW